MTAPTAPMTDPAAPAIPMGFRGLLLPTNTPSGDARTFTLADGADVRVRPLPLALSAQEVSADGHLNSYVIGRIERVWLGDGGVWCEGQFNPNDPRAIKWATDLSTEFAGWVSADLDESQYFIEYTDANGKEVLPEALADLGDDEDVEANRIFPKWRIMGGTLVATPAFAEARMRSCDVAELEDTKFLPIVASGAPAADDAEPEHKGGMVALLPTAEDQARLAVDGGDNPDQLHTTIAYLGDDVTGWTPEQQQATLEALQDVRPAVLDGNVMGHASFNPGAQDPNRSPCAVYLTEADGLSAIRQQIVDALKGHPDCPVTDETDTFDTFLPHITAGYDMDASKLTEAGPIRYDRLRIAMAGQNHDIPLEQVTAGLVAAAIVYKLDDFADPQLDGPTPITVTADGRVYGHIACWGTCHIGINTHCEAPPMSTHEYGMFHQGTVDTDAGMLPVGRITMNTGHADVYDPIQSAKAHYDHTGTCVAVVRAGEDAHGIWFSGKTVPGLNDNQIAMLKRSSLSGDWRQLNRYNPQRELIAALCVNTPGYPIPRTEAAMVASAGVGTLVAAGVIARENQTPIPRPQPRSAHSTIVDPSQIDNATMRAGATAESILRARGQALAQVADVRTQVMSKGLTQVRDRVRAKIDTDRRIRTAAEQVAGIVASAAATQVASIQAERLAQQMTGIVDRRNERLAAEHIEALGHQYLADAPGGRMPPELKNYWLNGKGAAKWVTNPHPYTALVAALQATKDIADSMTPEQIKGLAANLYKAKFGKWPGDHNGKPGDGK